MPQGQKSRSVLTVIENKTYLAWCFAEYLEYFMLSLTITATESENTIQFNQAGWINLDKCNPEEADISIALHDTNSDADCMIVSNDICL